MLGNPLFFGDDGYQISRSVRTRSSASAYFNRTPASVGNRQKFTWSGWIKRGILGTTQVLITAGTSATDRTMLLIEPGNELRFYSIAGGTGQGDIKTTAVFRDPSAWYHVVYAVDTTQATAANRLKIYVNNVLQTLTTTTAVTLNANTYINNTTAHTISRESYTGSNYFDGYHTEMRLIDGQQLDPSSFGETDAATGVWSPKKYTGTYGTNGFYLPFSNNTTQTSGNLVTYSEDFTQAVYTKERATITANATTSPRGSSNASKLVEDSTASNTHRWYYSSVTYANSVSYTVSIYAKAAERSAIALENWNGTTATYCYADLSTGTVISGSHASAVVTSVGNGWYRCSVTNTGTGAAGCGAALYLMNSATAGATVYTGNGTSGVYCWGSQCEANSVAGTYYTTTGTAISSTLQLGADSSTSLNSWVANNISLTAGVTYDSMLDVPTQWADGGNGRGNYPVWNPLQKGASAINTTATLSQANLLATGGAISNTWSATSTFVLPQTGKWYFECEMSPTAYGNGQFGLQSLSNSSVNCVAQLGVGAIKNNVTAYSYTGYNAGSTNKIGIAYDADNNLYWQTDINGNWLNSKTPGIDTTGLVNGLTVANDYVIGWIYNSGAEANLYCYVNFGQRPFSYTPPSGFKALNTQNLPTPTILKGNQYFDATTYTGTGAALSVTNSGSMQPDLVWIKGRSFAYSHLLFDSIRGAGFYLSSNNTNAEATLSGLTSFDADGFSLGVNANANNSGTTYVGWQWKEGATQGFDIVTYTGDGTSGKTVSHNLGVAPAMIITKSRDSFTNSNWSVYHQSLGATKGLILNTTSAAATSAGYWNNTAPTSSVFSLGNSNQTNNNLSPFIAYLFAEVAGFSKFGSYTGNQSADGPFVHLGFKPRLVMIKSATLVTGAWLMIDTSRDTYNASGLRIDANASTAEVDSRPLLDITSNGFKVRVGNNDNINAAASQPTYIYAAFAENPFKYSLAR